jgi:histidine triad (HIT) family protein
MSDKTLFSKIIEGDIPSDIIHEDDKCVVLNDISPQAPVHLLVIPKKPIPRIAEAAIEDADILGHILLTARDMAKKLELLNGFRIVINNGQDGGETVPHLHVHVLGGRSLGWPPG